MAGLEALTSVIYHERQQSGSMLCAQHALNSLLQGHYFTAPDLAHIAKSVDSQERESLDEESYEDVSANMDDTGFFSVQVIENALKVWGLNLVRWRSEQMRPYHATPHTQLAFVLNLQQHWFTLRRFGPAVANLDLDAGEGHWYNLNSSLKSPEWIGRLYLDMVLQQAEDEGYSVFAVCQADPQGPLALPRVEADVIATTLTASDSSDTSRITSSHLSGHQARLYPSSEVAENGSLNGFEDEDMELQAVLQASLMKSGHEYHTRIPAPSTQSSLTQAAVPGPSSEGQEMRGQDALGLSGINTEDPVAVSMARNRAIMDRMRKEQEAALRESYEEEVAQFSSEVHQQQTLPHAHEEVRTRRLASGEEEQEEATIHQTSAERWVGNAEQDMEESDYAQLGQDTIPQQYHPVSHSLTWAGMTTDNGPRVYDDDDAELQEALRASLAGVPGDFSVPNSPPSPPMPTQIDQTMVESGRSVSSNDKAPKEDEDMSERVNSPSPVPQTLDMDEVRRRRLARFGG